MKTYNAVRHNSTKCIAMHILYHAWSWKLLYCTVLRWIALCRTGTTTTQINDRRHMHCVSLRFEKTLSIPMQVNRKCFEGF